MYEVEDERPKEKETKKPTKPDSKAKVGYCPFCFFNGLSILGMCEIPLGKTLEEHFLGKFGNKRRFNFGVGAST